MAGADSAVGRNAFVSLATTATIHQGSRRTIRLALKGHADSLLLLKITQARCWLTSIALTDRDTTRP
jgi:hypothetical protein